MTQRRKFLGAALGFLGLAKTQAKAAAPAGENQAGRPEILFVHRDTVIAFDPVTGLGTHLGTCDGKIQGTTIVNFQFIPLSQTEIRFDNRVLITDLDGDQILFRQVGAGRFITPLSDSSVVGKAIMGVGGPLGGTYECTQASGKWGFLVGRKFGHRTTATNPAAPGPGCVYVEVYVDQFNAPAV
jgi:hypothetical protein